MTDDAPPDRPSAVVEAETRDQPEAREPCACGSGLTAAHCCAFDPATAPPPEETAHLAPLVEEATRLVRAGDHDEAARLAIEVLEQAPRRPPALAVLAEVRLAQRRPRPAAALLEQLMQADPAPDDPASRRCGGRRATGAAS